MVVVRSAFVVASIALPSTAFAEVSDKAPTIAYHWLFALPLAVALFMAGAFRWWLGVLLIIVPVFVILGSIDLTFDPHVGRALLQTHRRYPRRNCT